MSFLVDESLSPRVAELLRAGGMDAVHVLDLDLGGAPDAQVSGRAATDARSIISADSDFATLLALSQARHRRWSCSARATSSDRTLRRRF